MRIHLMLVFCAVLSAGALLSRPFLAGRNLGEIKAIGQMLEPRSDHTSTLLPNGKVLVAGGMRRNQDFYRTAELYDPATRRFEFTGEMHEARVGHIAVPLLSGKVLVAGGWIGHGCTKSAELYDPATGKFVLLSQKMTEPRGDARATLLKNGDVLITGGGEANGPGGIASAELFNSATGTFQAIAPMHFARVSHTSTLLNDGRVLIAGGRGDRVNQTAEIYDPKTTRFTVTGNLITARYKHTAGVLQDGRVLIAGGSDERDWNGNLSSAEIYDPSVGRFQAASAMNESRFKLPEESVRLESGKILIAGGSKIAEVFDASNGSFLRVPSEMDDSRHFMTETKLQDGSILLAGGYANNDRSTASAWIYYP
jgi:Kelch motif/Galactose oxidase, central domain